MSDTPRTDTDLCPNCKEIVGQCACMRNKCHRCGESVGNITFTVCDKCWDTERELVEATEYNQRLRSELIQARTQAKDRDSWRKCAEALAKCLDNDQVYHCTEEAEDALEHFNQLKGKESK